MQSPTLQPFLSGLSTTLSIAAKLKRVYDKDLALEFNPLLQFFPIGENKLSQIIAFFLDPSERHGQGDVFLQTFLNEFLPDAKVGSFSNVRVRCEHATPANRRLDIYLNFDGGLFGIGIETKIWAADQVGQIRDYNQFLDETHKGNYCLLYLPARVRTPGEHSISKEELASLELSGRFVCRDHSKDLTRLLSIWITQCQADNVKTFIKNLHQQIQHTINGERFMGEIDMIADFVLSTDEHLRMMQAINRASDGIYDRLFSDLRNKLEVVAREVGVKFVNYTLEGTGKPYTYFTFGIQQSGKELFLQFQFDAKDHCEFFWGFFANGGATQELTDVIGKALGDSEPIDDNWVWWRWYEPRHWDDNEEAYVEVRSGVFVQKVKQLLLDVVPKIRAVMSERPDLVWQTATLPEV